MLDEPLYRALMQTLRQMSNWRVMFSTFEPELVELDAEALAHYLQIVRQDRHPHREILFIIAGSGEYYFHGKLYAGNGGEIFFFDSYDKHSYDFAPSPAERLVLFVGYDFDGSCVTNIYRVLTTGKLQNCYRQVVDNVGVARQLYLAWDQALEPGLLAPELIRMRLSTGFGVLLQEIVVQITSREHPPEPTKRSVEQRYRLETITRYIHINKGRDCSIRKLAQMVHYSEFHFMKLFREHYQCSVKEYINQIRLNTVQEAEGSGLLQKEIATILGFSSPSSFNAWLTGERKKRSAKVEANEPSLYSSN